ncbi:MAG: 50S ribosomal protein L4 [Candidatus Desulfofervidaceae bacterium]|nr:50S ribosomal protein L4 [Candidatus Desulfofervidaceae bacterium]MDL1970053.1 50S ribosomal protein L4 [Candidatus Desulfofervidaceae bacterium]
MPEVKVYNQEGQEVGNITLADDIFDVPVKPYLIYEVVKWQLACRRAGTASTKSRGEVRGGGRKPWRQKGTGRARQGSIRAPHWVGGGVVFGPKPRSYAYSLPKKVRKRALKMALTSKLKADCLRILDNVVLDEIKTKKFLNIMKTLNLPRALIVTEGKVDGLRLASRNVPAFQVLPREGLNVYDILRYDYLVILQNAIPKIEESLRS